MNSKHLTIGDACPPLPKDGKKIRMYSMRFCPFAQRPLLVAAAKRIPLDVVNCNLVKKPEFLFQKHAAGKVPVLELEGGTKCVSESLIICDYFDEMFPEGEGKEVPTGDADGTMVRKLHPIDPLQKALDRVLVQNFSSVISLEYTVLMLPPDTKDDDVKSALKALMDSLQLYENELAKRGTKFFAGNDLPGMLDYMIWPWFERLPSHEMIWGSHFNYQSEMKSLKCLDEWMKEMTKDPAVQDSYFSPELHGTYRLSKKRGDPQYDEILQMYLPA